jgi:hypothetical protein
LSAVVPLLVWGPATALAGPAKPPATIVVGFVGGFVRHNDMIHQEVQLAAHLGQDFPTTVTAKIFENHQGRQAYQSIVQLLDTDHSGQLSEEEKQSARIVLYGHSWGASEAITLARALGKDRIPVLLTVQVDSVTKPGSDDGSIPANVGQAINFYQLDGLLHGRSQILAADSTRTQILGNIHMDYKSRQIDTSHFPWYAQIFMKQHIEIESDPEVWGKIESLIRSKIPAVP